MQPLSPAFARATVLDQGSSTFWMLLWIIVLDDNRQRREKERRRRRQVYAQAQRRPTPPCGPRPF
jgi:hypothetical protein